MRKPKDYDAELKALTDKAKKLKSRKVTQLGELVTATGADALSAEELAGVLLDAANNTAATQKEAWRKRGAAFFSGAGKTKTRHRTGSEPRGAAAEPSSAQPLFDGPGAA
ncbi:conjugal transfer protein TraD [Novosphingobium sp. MBES04]|uniref:conjugal transfer protein TraD n=1 Tax=Novosphingobium sp. MBES04 TaxID=1206458 RepID=UPI00057C4298|nr:conjugal transfer protein TraD [Novosphingobium sp. MBES04]GAM05565.1 conjugal transfer protein TraD [Novosphingobium sp. MBES04]